MDATGKYFATLGAGPNSAMHLESAANRPRDVNVPSSIRIKLNIPCQYSDEDAAIEKLFAMSEKYNGNKLWYTLLPFNVFGIPSGFNSNSFISGLGVAAGFKMPLPGQTGANTPGYQNPVASWRFIR